MDINMDAFNKVMAVFMTLAILNLLKQLVQYKVYRDLVDKCGMTREEATEKSKLKIRIGRR